MRIAKIDRKTAETDIKLKLNLDGKGKSSIDTGVGFLDHMLTLFAKHGGFDLDVICKGDTEIDYHHSVEDIAICLGKALYTALGDMKGIKRYGDIILPMDESLILCALDISGRSYLKYDFKIRAKKVGDFDTELAEEFMQSFVRNAKITLHLKQIYGTNSHHIIEGTFKALARTLKEAVEIDEKRKDEIPSTKGVL
jgi:imidazoleglycerol-phosphate dehydratase